MKICITIDTDKKVGGVTKPTLIWALITEGTFSHHSLNLLFGIAIKSIIRKRSDRSSNYGCFYPFSQIYSVIPGCCHGNGFSKTASINILVCNNESLLTNN